MSDSVSDCLLFEKESHLREKLSSKRPNLSSARPRNKRILDYVGGSEIGAVTRQRDEKSSLASI